MRANAVGFDLAARFFANGKEADVRMRISFDVALTARKVRNGIQVLVESEQEPCHFGLFRRRVRSPGRGNGQ
jgi:hypothetical protein